VHICALPSCRGCLTASARLLSQCLRSLPHLSSVSVPPLSASPLICLSASALCLTDLPHWLMTYLYVAHEVWYVDNREGVAATWAYAVCGCDMRVCRMSPLPATCAYHILTCSDMGL
jgi:hypothetical protein